MPAQKDLKKIKEALGDPAPADFLRVPRRDTNDEFENSPNDAACDPADFADRESLRAELGYAPDELVGLARWCDANAGQLGKVDFRCIRFPGLISALTVPWSSSHRTTFSVTA